MNKVFLLGRLTRDPEIRTTQSGKMTTSFTLAVDRFGSKEADFISVVTWEKLAENCGNSLLKGHRCLVEGRLQIRSFDGKDGQKRWVTEVIAQSVQFLERKNEHKADDTAGHFGQDVPDDDPPF